MGSSEARIAKAKPMSNTAARNAIHASLETSASHAAARAEGAALAGDLGIDSQLVAMSEQYRELRSQGRWEEARAMKLRAVALKSAADAYIEGAK